MVDGLVNPNFALSHQGIIGLGKVYYNLIEPTIVEHALARKEGQLGIGGALLVSTGKFTGRSPKDKHIVPGHGITIVPILITFGPLDPFLAPSNL